MNNDFFHLKIFWQILLAMPCHFKKIKFHAAKKERSEKQMAEKILSVSLCLCLK